MGKITFVRTFTRSGPVQFAGMDVPRRTAPSPCNEEGSGGTVFVDARSEPGLVFFRVLTKSWISPLSD